MSARFLDDEARAAFTRAIETIEQASAVEVVIAVRRRSHDYRHVNLVIGMAIAFVGLAVMLFAEHRFTLRSILIDPFAVSVGAALLVELLPGVKRWLTTPAARRRHVHQAARSTFVERGVHNTRGRSGLLVYISWLEQQVALVPDTTLALSFPADAQAAAEAALTAAMGKGGAAVARVLEGLRDELAKDLPRLHDDANELPDAIDSDLTRSQRR